MVGGGERKGEADDVGACVWEVRQVGQPCDNCGGKG